MIPRVVIHCAVSIDGRIDGFRPDMELYYQLITAWNEDATLAGCNTLLAASEAPANDTEFDLSPHAMRTGDPRPLLVVPDSRGRLRAWQYWLGLPYWRGGVALIAESTPDEYREYLERGGVEALVCGETHVDYAHALRVLEERHGVRTVRVDSGGTLNGILLRAGLVHEVSLLVHPVVVGGTSPKSVFRAPDLAAREAGLRLNLFHLEKMTGEIAWMRWKVAKA